MTARELPPNLTPIQLDTLRLVDQGLSDQEIANRLGKSRSAVRQTLAILRRKFGVTRKRHLVGEGRRFGFIDGNPHTITKS